MTLTLREKIKGALYGFALGDALGLGAEFMTRDEAKTYYPDGLRSFSQIIRDVHRSRWKRGEWTNDTRFLMAFIEQVLRDGRFDMFECAASLNAVFDPLDEDVASLFRIVMLSPDWLDNPVTVCHNAWKVHNIKEASNEALFRGIAAALTTPGDDLMRVTEQMVLITHDDSRCVCSAMILARMAYDLLHHGEPTPFDTLLKIAEIQDVRIIPYLRNAYNGSVDDLRLDDENTMNYTRKGMSAALWPVWHCDNAADSIHVMVDAAGDADTNAALAGALAGLRFGYDAIPGEKDRIINADRLDDLADRLTLFVQNID